MKILFDQGVPVPLRKHLAEHQIDTAFERGWSRLANGELLAAAEGDGYELFISTDQNLKFQQNLPALKLALIVLLSNSWPRIRLKVDAIRSKIAGIKHGDYEELSI
jgi:hypothetical protein